MSRPTGEIRQALCAAARTLAAEHGGATWREMAQQVMATGVCLGLTAARRTVENMARAGELLPAGTVKVPRSRRPMVRYAPRADSWVSGGAGALDNVLRNWPR